MKNDPSLDAAEKARAWADENRDYAVDELRSALQYLDIARKYIGRDDPLGREVSIAVTHIEDAILRLRHGSPR